MLHGAIGAGDIVAVKSISKRRFLTTERAVRYGRISSPPPCPPGGATARLSPSGTGSSRDALTGVISAYVPRGPLVV